MIFTQNRSLTKMYGALTPETISSTLGKKFLVTTDGGKSFNDVSITINGYDDLGYYYINNTPRLKGNKLVLDVSVPVENDLKDIELVSNDNGLTFSN